jgi:hypothetical protein
MPGSEAEVARRYFTGRAFYLPKGGEYVNPMTDGVVARSYPRLQQKSKKMPYGIGGFYPVMR